MIGDLCLNTAALRDHLVTLAREDEWERHVERETEAGRCPYCTCGILDGLTLGIIPCPECDGSGVALPN